QLRDVATHRPHRIERFPYQIDLLGRHRGKLTTTMQKLPLNTFTFSMMQIRQRLLKVPRSAWRPRLFRNHSSCRRGYRFGLGRGNRKSQPSVPAGGTIGGIKLSVASQAQVPLHLLDREKISDLGAYGRHTRLETIEDRQCAGVVCELVVVIADEADKNMLGQELRRSPVNVEVQPVSILGFRIFEIVGEAGNG